MKIVTRTFSQLNNRLFLTAVVFTGLLLRLYQLGTDSFWIDEVGAAQAIINPSLIEMLYKPQPWQIITSSLLYTKTHFALQPGSVGIS